MGGIPPLVATLTWAHKQQNVRQQIIIRESVDSVQIWYLHWHFPHQSVFWWYYEYVVISTSTIVSHTQKHSLSHLKNMSRYIGYTLKSDILVFRVLRILIVVRYRCLIAVCFGLVCWWHWCEVLLTLGIETKCSMFFSRWHMLVVVLVLLRYHPIYQRNRMWDQLIFFTSFGRFVCSLQVFCLLGRATISLSFSLLLSKSTTSFDHHLH